MAKDKRTVAAVAVLLLSAILFSLGLFRKDWNGGAPIERVITVIPKGTASPWWEVVHRGAKAAGEEIGCKIIWTGPEQESNREQQIRMVEDAVSRRSAAIVLGPNDGKALIRPVRKIKEANIPCVLIDSALEEEVADAMVTTDNYAGGVAAARLLGAALGGKGTVLLVKFIQNSLSTDQRAEGFRATLKTEFPEITIVDEQFTTGGAEDAMRRTEDMLTSLGGKVDGLFAVNQPTAIGAYKALLGRGLAGKVRYVGFDSDPVLLPGVASGEIYALLVQNPYEIGYRGVKAAHRLLLGEKVPPHETVPTLTVNAANLEQMKKDFPAALGL